MGLFDSIGEIISGDDAPANPQQSQPRQAAPQQQVSAKPVVATPVITQKIRIGSNATIELGADNKPMEVFELAIPTKVENRHTLIAGTTGAGKSMLFYQFQDTIKIRGDKAIIVDHGGENIARYYNAARGDVILNPFDARWPGWNPFSEIRNPWDVENFCRYVIPKGEGSAVEWNRYAQNFLAAAIHYCRESQSETSLQTIEDLLYVIDRMPAEQLAEELNRWPAGLYFAKGNEKMAASIRAIASGYLGAWKYFPDADANWVPPSGKTFSIRDWIQNDNDKRWVFLSYTEDMYDSLKSYISMAVSIAITYCLTLPTDDNRRVWFMLDELATLERISTLVDALTKIRKKGGCIVAGLQSTAQGEECYGKLGAQVLYSCFNTWITFRPGDADTAEMFSKHYGEQEIWDKEFSDNSGMGGGGMNAGESVSTKKKRQRVVDYTDLMLLPDLTAMVKLPGKVPVGTIKIPYTDDKRPRVAQEFIPRAGFSY